MNNSIRAIASGMAAFTAAAVMMAGPGPTVRAGVLDAPVPDFGQGKRGLVVYRMGPVYFEAGSVDTVIRCTNVSDAPIDLAVEVFGESGDLKGVWKHTALAPRQTMVYSTSPSRALPNAEGPANLDPIDHGKARVSATSAQVSCDAQHVVLDGNGGTARTSTLEMVKRVAQ